MSTHTTNLPNYTAWYNPIIIIIISIIIIIIQGSACEVMMIRTARRYDIETDTVIFANGIPFSKEDMAAYGGMQVNWQLLKMWFI